MRGAPEHPQLKFDFQGGRYGSVTRECDLPGGSVHIKYGKGRTRKPIDRSSHRIVKKEPEA